MLRNKKKWTTALAALSLITLVACDTDEIKYPTDYSDKLPTDAFYQLPENQAAKTAQDTLKQYYQSLTNDDAIYEKTVSKIFDILADHVHDIDEPGSTGSEVYHVLNDFNKKSVADAETLPTMGSNKDANLQTRAEDTMLSTAKGGSYKKNNMWDEAKYAKYLNENYYYLSTVENTDNAPSLKFTLKDKDLKNQLVFNSMTYSDVYSLEDENQKKGYQTYMENELFNDTKVNYLTSEYIIKKSSNSIANSNARKVQVISIADRSDEPGDAKQLLDAYVEKYILHKDGSIAKDDDFSVLSRLWKGITLDSIASLYNPTLVSIDENDYYKVNFSDDAVEADKKEVIAFFKRYGVTVNEDGIVSAISDASPVIRKDEYDWLKNKVKLDTEANLTGKLLDDQEKIAQAQDNWHKIDSSLEDTYTGSHTYSLSEGFRNSLDDIATRNLVTDGLYLKSSGISSLPSGLTDRIFSTKVTSNKDDVKKMKDSVTNGKFSSKSDLTCYAPDGYRYMTVADTITSNEVDSILYYDASSKTYYITRILDVVDNNAINGGSSSIYDSKDKLNQIKWEVAYALSTTGSYKTDSSVYWLSRMDWSFSDEAFLEYMKTNYKDIFKTENPYSDLTKFDLKKWAE